MFEGQLTSGRTAVCRLVYIVFSHAVRRVLRRNLGANKISRGTGSIFDAQNDPHFRSIRLTPSRKEPRVTTTPSFDKRVEVAIIYSRPQP